MVLLTMATLKQYYRACQRAFYHTIVCPTLRSIDHHRLLKGMLCCVFFFALANLVLTIYLIRWSIKSKKYWSIFHTFVVILWLSLSLFEAIRRYTKRIICHRRFIYAEWVNRNDPTLRRPSSLAAMTQALENAPVQDSIREPELMYLTRWR